MTDFQSLHAIYDDNAPEILNRLMLGKSLIRIGDIDMNCGVNRTSFPLFRSIDPYSRLTHSIGTGLIAWHFSKDEKQFLAGLFHDIATPVFAHTVDFMNGDYLNQESTEDGTEQILENDPIIHTVLQEKEISLSEVSNYHIYPICDNESPRLSADRLEYTLGNILNYRFGSMEDVRTIYRNLCVSENEFSETELCFRSKNEALKFAELALRCSKVYVCDADRYSMQILSEILKDALEREVLKKQDLYSGETECIAKLCSDPLSNAKWMKFTKMSRTLPADESELDGRRVFAKLRCIDPYVIGHGRCSEISDVFRDSLTDFLEYDMNRYIKGE